MHLENFTLIVVRDFMVFDAHNLLIGKKTTHLLRQNGLPFRTLRRADILVPQLLARKTVDCKRRDGVRGIGLLTGPCLSA